MVLKEEVTTRQAKAFPITTSTSTVYDMIGSEPGAKEFLDSISRNSKGTQKTYAAGLLAFHKFLDGKYTLAGIIEPLKKNEIDVYVILNDFVSYLLNKAKHQQTGSAISIGTIYSYMTAARSYLQFNDVDIAMTKFKRKVKMPKLYKEDEEAVDAADIRKILLSCNNRRLKPYLLVLASGGLRAIEALALRLCDINLDTSPTKVHVRKEYAKTKVARDVYISDEATRFLKEWLKWKYRARGAPNENDLVFTHYKAIHEPEPGAMYTKIRSEFVKVLDAVGFDKRKEGLLRRTITLHSFRRHVKTVISDQVSKDYSEWFLGHSKSPYYTMKEPMRREIYATKCMRYLTYLDYSALEATGKSIEKKLETEVMYRDKEIESLKEYFASEISKIKQDFDSKIKQEFDMFKKQNEYRKQLEREAGKKNQK